MFFSKAKQSNEKFDASQLHDQEKPKHKTEILPDDGTGDVEVEINSFDVFVRISTQQILVYFLTFLYLLFLFLSFHWILILVI